MPPFVPTAENRNVVQALAGFGIPHVDIARLIINPRTGSGISLTVLLANFAEELAVGLAKANAKVAGFLFKKASGEMGDDGAAITAAIFWLKCRAGWKTAKDDIEEAERYFGKKEAANQAAQAPPPSGSTWDRLLN